MEIPALPEEDIEAALQQVLSSNTFAAVGRLSKFLSYVVRTTLAGRQEQIKETVIAIDVYGRDADFDPRTNPMVRVDASRLRRRIKEYYAEEGAEDDFRIELPKGTYVPRFIRVRVSEDESTSLNPLPVQDALNFPCIGILEFATIGETDNHLGQGLTEEIKHNLQRFADLRVIAPHANSQGEALRQLNEVNAQYLLEGSVQLSGDRVRVITSLLNLSTNERLWSERWDRMLEPETLFDLQDEIAERTVGNVASPYGVINRDRLKQSRRMPPAKDVQTYAWVVRYYDYQRYETAEVNTTLREVFLNAVKEDENHAHAWAILSHLELDRWRFEFQPGLAAQESIDRSDEYANKALTLDPSNTLALHSLVNVCAHRKNYDQFVAMANRMMAVNPCEARAIGWISMWYAMFEDWSTAMEYARRAKQLNPLDTSTADVAEMFCALHESDGALAWSLIEPYQGLKVRWAQACVMLCAYMSERHELAVSVLSEMLELYPSINLEDEFRKYPFSDSKIEWILDVVGQVQAVQKRTSSIR